VNVIQKPLFYLKDVSPNLTKHLKGFGSGSTALYAKLDADTLLDSAIYRSQNETRSRKITRGETMPVRSAVSRGRLVQKAFGHVTLPPLSSSFTEALKIIIARELSDTTSYSEVGKAERIGTGYGLGGRGSIPGRGWDFRDGLSVLSSVYWGLFLLQAT
jgi:hypothetical protein